MAFREAVLMTEPYGDLLKGKAEVNYSYFFSDDYNEKYIHTYICAFSGFIRAHFYVRYLMKNLFNPF